MRTVNESHSTAAAVAIDSSKAAVRGEARKWEERRQSERQRKEGRGEARKGRDRRAAGKKLMDLLRKEVKTHCSSPGAENATGKEYLRSSAALTWNTSLGQTPAKCM